MLNRGDLDQQAMARRDVRTKRPRKPTQRLRLPRRRSRGLHRQAARAQRQSNAPTLFRQSVQVRPTLSLRITLSMLRGSTATPRRPVRLPASPRLPCQPRCFLGHLCHQSLLVRRSLRPSPWPHPSRATRLCPCLVRRKPLPRRWTIVAHAGTDLQVRADPGP